MIGHYLASAFRNFRRRPVSAAIKLLALGLGLACLLSAHMIGDYFGQTDRSWAKADRIHVVVQETRRPGGAWESAFQSAGPATAKYLRADFPELEAVGRIFGAGMSVTRPEGGPSQYGAYVDPELLDIFDLDMAAGEASLDRPGAVLINERAAAALFGDEDPIGRSLTVRMSTVSGRADLHVAGVFREMPANSHLGRAGQRNITALTSLDTWRRMYLQASPGAELWWEEDNFSSTNFTTYVLLPADGSLTAADLNRRLEGFAARHVPPDALARTTEVRFRARPVGQIARDWFDELIGLPPNVSLVSALYLLGALTLAVGCVNFAALAAVESLARAKEIGLRKALGARRRQVAAQMLAESVILAAAALALALPVAALAARAIAARFALDIPLPGPGRIDYWAGVAGIAAGAAIAAGAYPAMILARLRPALAIRAGGAGGRAGRVRGVLTGAQFAAAGFLAIMVLVALFQAADQRRDAIQADGDPLVSLAVRGAMAVAEDAEHDRLEGVRRRLLDNPAITGVTYLAAPPFYTDGSRIGEYVRSADPSGARFVAQRRTVYHDYFETAGAPLLAGRSFERERDEADSIVIDAATAAVLGYSPQEAVGQTIRMTALGEPVADPPTLRIIGVVAHEPLELAAEGPSNYVYSLQRAWMPFALVRLSPDSVDAGLAHLRRVWRDLDPAVDPDPAFLDAAFERAYRGFRMLMLAASILSAVALSIAAMGLFGLASFAVRRRVREIGVRKTLGASTARVMRRLLWDFSKPVIAANLVAWPFAMVAARAYLDLFVTRIALTPAPFLIALLPALAIAWIAVGGQTWRAARLKPANVLKDE